MLQSNSEPPEFTDEQLRAALKRVGEEARQSAFTAGWPVIAIKGRSIVALHADGKEEILETLSHKADAEGEYE